MKPRYLVWTGHSLGLVLVLFGLWWLLGHISGMPDYKLVVVLAALTGLVLNHIRWRSLGKNVNDPETFEKINLLMVSNYLILLFLVVLADFHG
jgi:uncharacterized membrane protein